MSKFNILGVENISYNYGGKAYGLYLLDSVGLQIPETLIVPYNLHISDYKYQIEDFVENIVIQYGKATTFAVRSSASNEDGKNNSWAGIYDTKLFVTAETVYETVYEMYYNTNTTRQEAYSIFTNSTLNVEMSLVVQRMIEPTVSGVCFSVNPINGNNTEIVIEAVEGSGDKLVGGIVTPQMYILNESGNCIYFDEGDYIMPNLLSNYILCQIVKKINYIKKALYQEADIEFALQNHKIFFLQIRPITRIYKSVVQLASE